MIRDAKRKLSGRIPARDWDIRVGEHENGGPAVTIDLGGSNHSRTFNDPNLLLELALDLRAAAQFILHTRRQEEAGDV